jgi:diguanylate cyclase (GGDEF)-like protein
LMILDLDHFKSVNDLLGHAAGDQLLIDVAERVKNCIRETDTLARLGGDEFAIIATQLNRLDDASVMAKAIVDACHFSVESVFEELHISCSIGIALYPRDSDNPTDLLKRADMALLKSKAHGESCFHFSDASTNLINEDKQLLNDSIEEALGKNDFSLYFQPIISCLDSRVMATEALLRWQHPILGVIPPKDFIPIFEARGLGQSVAEWTLDEVQKQQKKWRDSGLPEMAISIKLSPFQLEYHTLNNILNTITQLKKFSAKSLQFEIDESAIFTCSKETFDALFELHQLGIKIIISNFGRGFCSLTQLHQLPVNAIKINCGLVQQLPNDKDARAITEAIIHLCKAMNIDVIAHGVENIQVSQYLADKNCDYIQGYSVSHPLNGRDFGRWHFKHWNQDLLIKPH